MPTATQVTTSGTVAQRLAAYITELRFDQLPAEVVAQAKDLLAYDLAQGLRGVNTEEGRQAVGLAVQWGGGNATIIGSESKARPLDAAFANTTMMRVREMDDVLFPAGIHAGLVTIPGALAIAETRGLSGKELIVALVAGYDTIGKLASGLWSWDASVPRRPTIPFGPFGGAAVTSKLCGLAPSRTAAALGYAAHSAMGLAVDPWPHYYSLVTRNGMMAAFLAEAGAVPAPDILEARFGFYETFFGAVPEWLDRSLEHLGRDFDILNASSRRYPGTGLNILAVEQARDIIVRQRLTPTAVQRIELVLPEQTRNFTGRLSKGPFHDPIRVPSSLPYQVAIVLLDGGETNFARYQQFDDPQILDILKRIEIHFEDGHESPRYARVVVECVDGSHHVSENDSFAFPQVGLDTLSAEGSAILPRPQLERAVQLIESLEEVSSIGQLMACFQHA